VSAFFQELFRTGLYKRSQGRITRQVTFAAGGIIIALGMLRLVQTLQYDPPIRYGIPAVLFVVGCWITYRLVNFPGFADFLIAVEAEMNKVSWPTRSELIRSSLVVLIVIFVLAATLFGFDFLWRTVFTKVIPIL
jgi:preprotein translocase subunit SecE